MSKRSVSIVLLIAALLLAACGPAATPTTAPAQNTPAPAANTVAPAANTPAPAATASTGAVTPGLPADAATQDKQILKIAWAGFGSQEPLAPSSVRWGGQAVAANEFMTPVYPDVTFNFKPLLATAITPNADKTVWTLKVDPRAVWSDGKKVTAADIKASWEWSADPAQKIGNVTGQIGDLKGYADVAGGKAKEITGLVAKDDATLEMTLNGPDPFFDTKLGQYAMGVLPVDKLKADPQYLAKPNPVVNGPFQVTQIDATGRQIVMKQNPKWWGAKPILQEIDLIVAEEQTAFETLVEKGQVDFAYSFAGPAATRALEARATGTTELATKLPVGIYSSFHQGVPPNDDINVRKALVHAIDFKALATAATEGLQQPWLAFLHPELKLGCYSKDSEAYFAFDPAKAKQELAASKYGSVDKLPKLRVSSNSTGAAQQKALQIIMEMWRTNLGINNIEFQTQPSGFGPDEKNLNVDRQSIAARPPDDGLWITQLLSNQIHAVRFMGGYKNDALDKQLAAIVPMDRKDPNFCKAVQAAEKTFLDDYMWIPLWRQSGDFGLVQPWVKNLFFGPYLVPYGWFDSPQAYITSAKK
jgi:peptide/nickel transport system substrate-binding protein